MNLKNYLALNIRHYSNEVVQFKDELAIKIGSRKKFEKMRVPLWDPYAISSVSSSESAFSRLFSLNKAAVTDADRIICGDFSLFGRTFNSGASEIKWNKDYFSGKEYPLAVFSRYSITQDTGTDIIVPWELSRLQFIPSLIQAYRLSGEQRYANHFFQVLQEWEKANPYLFGINWICGLDIAIRALNIALGLVYFDEINHPEHERASRLLWAHLTYLHERDLHQTKTTVNNHQLIAALLHYGLLHLFDQGSTASWRQASQEIIIREMERQFHADGGNFESALLYHQFVLEAAFASIGLIAGDNISDALADETKAPLILIDRLEKGTRFTASYTRAWGGAPQIGDSSDGRIIFHQDYFSWSPEDPGYLGDWSSLVFGHQDPFNNEEITRGAHLFAETGLGIYLTERYGALVTAMPIAANAAGHNHLDKTGVILQIRGIPVLIDSGTYCYTSDTAARYQFRQGRAHNVMLLGRHDQAELNIKEAFSIPGYHDVGILLSRVETGDPVFESWHDGYCRLPDRGKVTRRVQCSEQQLILRDAADGRGDEDIQLVFNIHPEIAIEQRDDHILLSHQGSPLCVISPPEDWLTSIEEGSCSSRYTSLETCPRLVFSRTASLPLTIETRITLL